MCKQILLQVILVATIIITSHCSLHAQHYLGFEAGATVTSLYTIQEPEPPIGRFASPTIGARVGVFFESEIKDFLAIKTGLFGVLKGCQLETHGRWNLVYMTIPVLVVFNPVKPLKLGIGVELGALIANNIPLLVDNKLSLGVRGEVAWQISPSFRLIAHGTLDLIPTTTILYTDDQGNIAGQSSYNNITGGLSLAYTIKTFDKKG